MPDLDGPEPPLELAYLWEWFQDLHTARGSNGMGPNPITYTDIAAWAGLSGITLRAPEIQAILMLDRLWLRSHVEGSKARQAWQEQQRRQPGRAHGR
jgi:hypothetical protein